MTFNRFLLISLIAVLNLAWPVCTARIQVTYCSIPLGFTYRQGIGKGLIEIFRCVRRSRNIQHISERCFPIIFDRAFSYPNRLNAHNYEHFSSHRRFGSVTNIDDRQERKRLFYWNLFPLRSAFFSKPNRVRFFHGNHVSRRRFPIVIIIDIIDICRFCCFGPET